MLHQLGYSYLGEKCLWGLTLHEITKLLKDRTEMMKTREMRETEWKESMIDKLIAEMNYEKAKKDGEQPGRD